MIIKLPIIVGIAVSCLAISYIIYKKYIGIISKIKQLEQTIMELKKTVIVLSRSISGAKRPLIKPTLITSQPVHNILPVKPKNRSQFTVPKTESYDSEELSDFDPMEDFNLSSGSEIDIDEDIDEDEDEDGDVVEESDDSEPEQHVSVEVKEKNITIVKKKVKEMPAIEILEALKKHSQSEVLEKSIGCKHKMSHGPRKGEPCDKNTSIGHYCKAHTKG